VSRSMNRASSNMAPSEPIPVRSSFVSIGASLPSGASFARCQWILLGPTTPGSGSNCRQCAANDPRSGTEKLTTSVRGCSERVEDPVFSPTPLANFLPPVLEFPETAETHLPYPLQQLEETSPRQRSVRISR